MKNRKMCTAAMLLTVLVSATGCGSDEAFMPELQNEKDLGITAEYAADAENGYYDGGMDLGMPDFNTEEYSAITENSFKSAAADPLSTFSIDVDTASYTNIRRMIRQQQEIPADAVRIEEMINYFHYDYPEPAEGEPFSVTTEMTDCPWNADTKLLMIGLKAQ